MNSFKSICVLGLFLLFSNGLSAQNRKLDKLEQLYAQEHYKLVFVRSSKLLDSPDYDFSALPKYYKSLSLFQLSKNEYWLKKNKNALANAGKLYNEVSSTEKGREVITAHIHEVKELKTGLIQWEKKLRKAGKTEKADQVNKILVDVFSKVHGIPKKEIKPPVKSNSTGNDKRSEIIAFAEKSIGVPYKWGGVSNSGFDCSGYTSYVMKEFGITTPRRAVDQYKASVKIKQKSAQKGDLVFFNNGSGISHVGIITSQKGEPLTMIHASSSQGITITNLEKSTYWMKRLHSFGTFVN